VFVSGSVDIPTAVQAIRDGAVDFLQKPYPQQQLLDAIYKALRWDSAWAHSMSDPIIIDAAPAGSPLG
jgi:FixJ family two-component response regulator